MKHESTDGMTKQMIKEEVAGTFCFVLIVLLVVVFWAFFQSHDTEELKAWKKHVEMCDKYNGMDLREVPRYCWPEGARTE